MDRAEIGRYVVNGLVATFVHFALLSFGMEWVGVSSAGLANFLAACIGISVSYLGSRYYVFRKTDVPVVGQATRFVLLYGFIAVLHGLTLFLWTDLYGFHYRIGFLIATGVQVSLSYLGNKFLVFS